MPRHAGTSESSFAAPPPTGMASDTLAKPSNAFGSNSLIRLEPPALKVDGFPCDEYGLRENILIRIRFGCGNVAACLADGREALRA